MALPKIQIATAADGDVSLVCGDTATETADPDRTDNPGRSLNVSSHALILSSDYFRKELRSPWKEGEELAANGTVTINLPEDDTEAMEIICHAVHHRTDSVPGTVSLRLLSKMAVLSDKYFFDAALKTTVTTWIRDYVSDQDTEATRLQRVDVRLELMAAARLLKHHKLAQRVMQGLILHATFPVVDMEPCVQNWLIEPPTLECLRRDQLETMHDIRDVIENAVSSIERYRTEQHLVCRTLATTIGDIMCVLSAKGIWPWQRILRFDLDEILACLEELYLSDVYQARCIQNQAACGCHAAPSPIRVSRETREGARRLRKAIGELQVEF